MRDYAPSVSRAHRDTNRWMSRGPLLSGDPANQRAKAQIAAQGIERDIALDAIAIVQSTAIRLVERLDVERLDVERRVVVSAIRVRSRRSVLAGSALGRGTALNINDSDSVVQFGVDAVRRPELVAKACRQLVLAQTGRGFGSGRES